MGVILANDWREYPLLRRAKGHIRDVQTVLDVGAGIRPQSIVTCRELICMEPHDEYADELAGAGIKVIRGAAPVAFDWLETGVDTVVMLDVIEHMDRVDGIDSLRRARALARWQVIVFTPLGFIEQNGGGETDAWGMQGQRWQLHRSGWTPEDFPGWLTLVDQHFAPKHPAFVAIWERTR